MDLINHDALLKQLRWRYATKKFDPSRRIPDEVWSTLEEALVLTPSSYGLQPWKFVVVTDPEKREQLVGHSWGQRQVADASHLVVMAMRRNLGAEEIERFIRRTAEVRGVTPESLAGFHRMLTRSLVPPPANLDINEWATRQVYIALGNFMTAAALLGIDTCPMEGINPANYDEVLGLPQLGYATVVACPAGYRADDDRYATTPKVRYATQDVVLRV